MLRLHLIDRQNTQQLCLRPVYFCGLRIFPGTLCLIALLPIDFTKALFGIAIRIFIWMKDLRFPIIGSLHLLNGTVWSDSEDLCIDEILLQACEKANRSRERPFIIKTKCQSNTRVLFWKDMKTIIQIQSLLLSRKISAGFIESKFCLSSEFGPGLILIKANAQKNDAGRPEDHRS